LFCANDRHNLDGMQDFAINMAKEYVFTKRCGGLLTNLNSMKNMKIIKNAGKLLFVIYYEITILMHESSIRNVLSLFAP
jgi:hypothetical protein